MDNRKFIGMLTPSSNTVLEPITNKILNSIVNYELVKISEFKQPDSIPSE